MIMFEKYYMAAMGGANGFENKSIKKLIEYFSNAKTTWLADEEQPPLLNQMQLLNHYQELKS